MSFAARLVLLCVIVLTMAGTAPATPLSELLDKMRAVNGGLYNMLLISTSPHLVDGMNTQALTEATGLRYVVHECSGAICVGTYFDGSKLYQFNVNGTLLPSADQPVPDLRAFRMLGTLEFLDPRFESQGGEIDDAGTFAFQGCRCRRIIVRGENASPVAVYVDPATGLVAGARGIEKDWIVAFADYRRIAAFELPFAIDFNGLPLERYTSRVIATGTLDPPRGLTPVVNDAEPSGLQLDPTAVSPIGTCTIAGIDARCMFDTGNSTMAMSKQLAQRLRLKPIGTLPIAGLENFSTQVVRAGPLRIGNVDFGNADYAVLGDTERYGYDLVLGADVLGAMSVTIDYQHHVLTFGDDDPVDDSNTLPLHFENFVPVVNAALDGKVAQLAVDTGDESNINLAYAYYLKHPDLFAITSTAQVGGVGGSSVEELGELSQIRLGGITAQDQPIGATRTLQGTADGHLGAAFLSKFRVVLDYPHEQLYLSPL